MSDKTTKPTKGAAKWGMLCLVFMPIFIVIAILAASIATYDGDITPKWQKSDSPPDASAPATNAPAEGSSSR